MDMFSKFLQSLGVKVHETVPPSPGATSTEVGTDATSNEESPAEPTNANPTLNPHRANAMDLVRGSQPTAVFALQSGDIAPSRNNGAELGVAARYGTRAVMRMPYIDTSVDKDTEVVDDGNRDRFQFNPIQICPNGCKKGGA